MASLDRFEEQEIEYTEPVVLAAQFPAGETLRITEDRFNTHDQDLAGCIARLINAAWASGLTEATPHDILGMAVIHLKELQKVTLGAYAEPEPKPEDGNGRVE